MGKLHTELSDYEYWQLRLRLLELQKKVLSDYGDYDKLLRDLLEEMNNYLEDKNDPWNL